MDTVIVYISLMIKDDKDPNLAKECSFFHVE